MAALDFAASSFDLVWAEGSAYILGFANALETWKPLLREPGYLAASELTWLRADSPQELREFFHQTYPPMQDIAANLAVVRQAGFDPIGSFTLPEDAWWRHYYDPIEERLATLRKQSQNHPDALEIIALHDREIALYREYSDFYGYVFYVMRSRPIS